MAFDADFSKELDLKEMRPFLKALQTAAFAAEEESKSHVYTTLCRGLERWQPT